MTAPRPLSTTDFARRLAAFAEPQPKLALAVSGGGDSMAMMLLAAELAAERRALGDHALEFVVFTVDHGLRSDSAAEAQRVGEIAGRLGLDHEILEWRHDASAPAANVQAAARAARYDLMRRRRLELGIGPLITAHTADDVAETFLLRLSRGSGVDGLAHMAPRRVEVEPDGAAPCEIWRPFLDVSGAALRATCRDRGVEWIEDPSNAADRFARSRARNALQLLEPLGFTKARLLQTAQNMARARSALEAATAALASEVVRFDEMVLAFRLDAAALCAAPQEIALRLAARIVMALSGADYPPRLSILAGAMDAVLVGPAVRTLSGCVFVRETASTIWIGREACAAAPLRLESRAQLWDRRCAAALRSATDQPAPLMTALGDRARKIPGADAPPLLISKAAPGIWVDGAFLGPATAVGEQFGVAITPVAPKLH